MNEQDLVLTVGVQIGRLDMPLGGLAEVQPGEIDMFTESLETDERLAVNVANRITDAVPVGGPERRKVRVREVAQPEIVDARGERGPIGGQTEPVEVGELSPGCR